jgi:ADP-dependent phosphofructokinase/glucokinase
MEDSPVHTWLARYGRLLGAIFSEDARNRPLFLCGMSACVDARVDTRDLSSLGRAASGSRPRALSNMLVDRAQRGVGGEVKFDWPDGPAWLRRNLAISHSLGGTGAQAAWVLARLGARPVMALEDRHALMLEQIPAGVLLAQNDELVQASEAQRNDRDAPETFIFEYGAGIPIGDAVPTRSSRIIVRFADRGLQDDSAFDRISAKLAPDAAAGLVSGLNDVAPDQIDEACNRTFGLTRQWRSLGLGTIHLELAGYSSMDALARVLSTCRGAVTSLGMSHSELLALAPDAQKPASAMMALSIRLDLDRLCVHADTWAASVVRGDPDHELRALMVGCAVASARAAAGAPVANVAISQSAKFDQIPFEESLRVGDRSFVSCAAPYLETPITTVGLGDSFTAGCLYVLGREKARHTRSSQC